MNTKDWVILKAISEERNLTKTAERLYISQPALTYRLHSLEKEFGVRILNRYPSGVSFTLQGGYLLKYAEEMLERLKSTKEYVQNMETSINGSLRLGIATVVAKFKMASILKTYKDRYPHVAINLKTGSSTLQLPDMLKNREIDIAILRGDFDWPEKKHILAEEPFCIVSAQPVVLNQLPFSSWIQYETSSVTKADKEYYRWWHEQFNSPLPPIVTVDSIEACLQLVSHGVGWTIVPKIHLGNRRSFFSYPVIWLDGHPMLKKTIMAYRNEVLDQPAANVFIDYVLNEGFA